MSAELDEYRQKVADMRLGNLINELIDLRLEPEPEKPKAKITQVQKIHEVVLQLNKREVTKDDEPSKPRKTRVRSLKNFL